MTTVIVIVTAILGMLSAALGIILELKHAKAMKESRRKHLAMLATLPLTARQLSDTQ